MNAAAMLALTTSRQSKYGNRKVRAYGYVFDSGAEYRRYLALRDMERRGEIEELEVHPRFELLHPFRDWAGARHRATYYEADFRYTDESGKDWVEDVKGVKTAAYLLKVKLFLSQYRGTCFREIPARAT
jgi:hypothetical protein